jgi:type II secretion system protein G
MYQRFLVGLFFVCLFGPQPALADRTEVAKAQAELFTAALDMFHLDVGRYPTTAEGLEALRTAPPETPRWQGPYLKHPIGTDPWGRPFYYQYQGNTYSIISYGADGRPGGSGKDADIIKGRSWVGELSATSEQRGPSSAPSPAEGRVLLLLIFAILLYFVPAVVATARGHHNANAIILTNILLGWTVVGWLVALIWAATAVNHPAPGA